MPCISGKWVYLQAPFSMPLSKHENVLESNREILHLVRRSPQATTNVCTGTAQNLLCHKPLGELLEHAGTSLERVTASRNFGSQAKWQLS